MNPKRGAPDPVELAADPVFRAAQLVLVARIILVVLALDPESFDTFTLPKSVIAHVCSAVLAALLVWLYLRRGREIVRWSPIHIGVGVTLLSFALATPFALDVNIALFGAWRRYLGLTQMLDHAVLYVAVVTLIRSTADLVRLALAAGVATFGVLGYGVIQRFGFDPIKYAEGSTVRPVSTLGNPDILGGYLSIAAVTSFGVLVALWGRLSPIVRVGLSGLALACASLLLTVGARNAVLGVAGGVLATALVISLSPGSRRGRLAALAAATAAVGLAVVLSGMGARLAPAALAADPALRERFELWDTALRLVAARPVLGLGPDNLVAGFPAFRTTQFVALFGPEHSESSTHDWGLYVLTSGGPVALLAVAFAIAAASAAALRLARRSEVAALALIPLLAYLGQGLVDINDLAVDWVFWISLAIVAGAAGLTLPARPMRRRALAARSYRLLGIALSTTVLIGAVWIELPRVASSRSMNQSEALITIKAGNLVATIHRPDAVVQATRAVAGDPRRAEYWSSLGTGLSETNPVAAGEAYVVAARREPWNPLYWQNLAVVYRASGNRFGARAAARRAVMTDPNGPDGHRLLSALFLDDGNFEAAATEGRQALASWADERSYDTTILAYIKLERWADAVELAQQGLALTNSNHLRLRLAQAYTGAGQIAQAKDQLAIVLAASPNDREALDLRDFLSSK